MSRKKHGLGKGLEALLYPNADKTDLSLDKNSNFAQVQEAFDSQPNVDSLANLNSNSHPTVNVASLINTKAAVVELDIHKIIPGRFQPRRAIHPEELESLAQSIKAQGVLQPIIIRPLTMTTQKEQQYEIIAGERRWRASQLAGLTTIPVIIKTVSDEIALALAIIENIQRENLNALEEAIALDRLAKEFSLTHAQIADGLGKSRVAVTNLIRLLTLTDEVKGMLEKGQLEPGHAKVLLGLRGHEQIHIAKMVLNKGLSVRETEKLVQQLNAIQPHRLKHKHETDPDIRRLITTLSERLGATIDIQHSSQGKGKLIIQYNSLDELDGIIEHIQ